MTEDYTTLNNPKFLYLAALHQPFPDWVVKEAMPESGDFEKFASTAFADPANRLLPICSKSATFHSALNAFAKADEIEEDVLERVKEACAHFEIELDVAPYADFFAGEMTKEASFEEIPEGRFAIDTTLGGENLQLLPLNDSDDVIESAFALAKMASEKRVHFLMFVPACREIVKAASEHGIDSLPLLIQRFGIERFSDAEKAAKLIEGREQFCKNASIRAQVAEDYRAALEGIEEDPDAVMEKIATIDHAAGIDANLKVSAGVPTPFDIVFTGPYVADAEKAAQENVMVRDVLIPISEVEKIASIDAEYRLSKEAAESFTRARETGDARDLSLAIQEWSEKDQKTFLRLAVASAA